jgi:hypothetical protein
MLPGLPQDDRDELMRKFGGEAARVYAGRPTPPWLAEFGGNG